MSKIIVYCHPRKINLSIRESHWQVPVFKQVLKDRYIKESDTTIDSIDIMPGGTITTDAFSDEFIKLNQHKYNIVILPDCAGPWFEFQKKDTQENLQSLLLLMIKLTKLVKPGGTIMFGKILYEKWFEILTTHLIEFGFDAQINTYPIYETSSIRYITLEL